jgi:peroxiredoxin
MLDSHVLGQWWARGLIAAALLAAIAAALVAFRATDSDDEPVPAADAAPIDSPSCAGDQADAAGALSGAGVTVGAPAPDFALRDVNGMGVRLADCAGSVVFVNFWATWCGPCKKELPEMQRLHEARRDEGLVILAINVEESAEQARAFFEERGLTMPLLLDSGGEVYRQYGLNGLPDSFFVDREGNVATLQYGQLSASKMRERLAAAGLP